MSYIFFVWIHVSQGLTLPLRSQEPGFSTFPCPFHVCKHFSNLEDPPKNCNYQMKLFTVVYMCSSLLDLTFESRELSEGGNKIKKWQLCNQNDNFFTQNHFESKQLSFWKLAQLVTTWFKNQRKQNRTHVDHLTQTMWFEFGEHL